MSIASELTALANNRDAIKAAIEAKGVADAGDTLAEFPAAIASIPSGGGGAPETEPYPWVGTGTHAWLHYDSNSRSHVCQVNFTYYGNVTLDWGDGSATVSLTGSSSATTTTQSHTYADGDFRLDITGETPLEFGHWDETSSSYKNTNASGFMSNATPFNQANMRRVPGYREQLVQFETDSPSVIGGGGENDAQIGASPNLRWVKFTAATELGRWPLGRTVGLRGLWAPMATRVFQWVDINQAAGNNLKILELPSLQSLYDRSGNNPTGLFEQQVMLEHIEIPFEVQRFPNSFLNRAVSLRSVHFLPNKSDPSAVRQSFDAGQNFMHRCFTLEELVLPEGLVSLSGESCAFLQNVRKIDLPSTFESASNYYAFCNTYGLEVLICRATTPPAISSAAFPHVPNAKYYIPYGTTAAYTAATNWSQFASLFVELNPDGTIPTT